MMYQVVNRHHRPWDVAGPGAAKPIEIGPAYDRTSLATGDTLAVDVNARSTGAEPTFMVILSLGLPPDFDLEAGDLAELLGEGKIDRYEFTQGEIRVYLDAMAPGQEFAFRYHLTARWPLRAKSASAGLFVS